MSTTSTERFLKQLYGISPGHRSPKVAPVASAVACQPLGEGVDAWLDRMWGIRFPHSERQAA